jgi:hypothetical protein
MKKLVGCILLSCCSTALFAEPSMALSDKAKVSLTFTKEIEGNCGLDTPLPANMEYHYNVKLNEGMAYLHQLNEQNTPVDLNALGLSDTIAFMSDLETPVNFKTAKGIYSFNMIFLRVDKDPTDPKKQVFSAMMRLHNEGHDCTIATENFVP